MAVAKRLGGFVKLVGILGMLLYTAELEKISHLVVLIVEKALLLKCPKFGWVYWVFRKERLR